MIVSYDSIKDRVFHESYSCFLFGVQPVRLLMSRPQKVKAIIGHLVVRNRGRIALGSGAQHKNMVARTLVSYHFNVHTIVDCIIIDLLL